MQITMEVRKIGETKSSGMWVQGRIANCFRLLEDGKYEFLPVTAFVGSRKFVPQIGSIVQMPITSFRVNKPDDEKYPHQIVCSTDYVFGRENNSDGTTRVLDSSDFDRAFQDALAFVRKSSSADKYQGLFNIMFSTINRKDGEVIAVMERVEKGNGNKQVKILLPRNDFPVLAGIYGKSIDVNVGDILNRVVFAFRVKVDEAGKIIGGYNSISSLVTDSPF